MQEVNEDFSSEYFKLHKRRRSFRYFVVFNCKKNYRTDLGSVRSFKTIF